MDIKKKKKKISQNQAKSSKIKQKAPIQMKINI